jgi:hypothetical protein
VPCRSPIEDRLVEGDPAPVPPAAGEMLRETRPPRSPLAKVEVRLAGAWYSGQLVSRRVLLTSALEHALV